MLQRTLALTAVVTVLLATVMVPVQAMDIAEPSLNQRRSLARRSPKALTTKPCIQCFWLPTCAATTCEAGTRCVEIPPTCSTCGSTQCVKDDTPATNPPPTDPPVIDPPVTDPPVTDPPVKDPPVKDPPVKSPPIIKPCLKCLRIASCSTVRCAAGTHCVEEKPTCQSCGSVKCVKDDVSTQPCIQCFFRPTCKTMKCTANSRCVEKPPTCQSCGTATCTPIYTLQ